VFEELGLPAETLDVAFVNGFMYTRLRPLIGASHVSKRPPPAAAIKVVSRVHPAFRKRTKTAQQTLRESPSNAVVTQWESTLRPRLLQANQQAQQFGLRTADDAELQRHISNLLDQLRSNFELHAWLHGHDLGPIARYLHSCLEWGLDPTDAISALAGASPTTAEPAHKLVELRELLEASETPIETLEDLRSSSDQARQLVDDYLDERGYHLVTGYDLNARTLIEMPAVVLSSIRAAVLPPTHNFDGIAGDLRNQIATSARAEFDRLLADARNVMDMRDDNGPLTIEWPMGLLRHALLEAGQRLAKRETVNRADHVFELTSDEARNLFGVGLPSAVELHRRYNDRTDNQKLEPPNTLGPVEPIPPLDAMPPALAKLTQMVQVAMEHIGLDTTTANTTSFDGAGIGDARYVGVARVASSADEAIDRLQPGEILVVRATSPAFNAILPVAGAIVTSDGGVLSHAAVLSRELGIPAVVGVPSAMDIEDGTTIEVDATAGVVRIVGSA